jgi:hypothetical protein
MFAVLHWQLSGWKRENAKKLFANYSCRESKREEPSVDLKTYFLSS